MIRSIQIGFSKFLKHVVSLIKFFRLYVAKNSEIVVVEVPALKAFQSYRISTK